MAIPSSKQLKSHMFPSLALIRIALDCRLNEVRRPDHRHQILRRQTILIPWPPWPWLQIRRKPMEMSSETCCPTGHQGEPPKLLSLSFFICWLAILDLWQVIPVLGEKKACNRHAWQNQLSHSTGAPLANHKTRSCNLVNIIRQSASLLSGGPN